MTGKDYWNLVWIGCSLKPRHLYTFWLPIFSTISLVFWTWHGNNTSAIQCSVLKCCMEKDLWKDATYTTSLFQENRKKKPWQKSEMFIMIMMTDKSLKPDFWSLYGDILNILAVVITVLKLTSYNSSETISTYFKIQIQWHCWLQPLMESWSYGIHITITLPLCFFFF